MSYYDACMELFDDNAYCVTSQDGRTLGERAGG